MRRAKVIATLGPASGSGEMIRKLLGAGVDVFRLNLSHGSHDDHRRLIELVRQVADDQGRHIPIIGDLMGPRYRLASIPEGHRHLNPGERVTLGSPASDAEIPVDPPQMLEHLQPGERVLVDNGLVELEVEGRQGQVVTARVVNGGTIADRKGINLPDTQIPFSISEKDRADIRLAVCEGIDFLAASYVGRAADVEAVRQAIYEAGGSLPLVAKLERSLAVENLEEIVAASEAAMVARGDLGVEVPLDTVPVLQKRIIEAGRRLARPVIVATQMLESMMEHPRPSRAESSDVANAVFDGADALMLSGETATGRYPVEVVETMVRIILQAESYQTSREQGPARIGGSSSRPPDQVPRIAESGGNAVQFEIPDAIAEAAVVTAHRLGAQWIVAFSQSGFTAGTIARYRPSTAIAVFTNDLKIARRVQLIWGARPLLMEEAVEHHDQVVEVVDRHFLASGLAEPGTRIVILMGDPIRDRPLTNLMRVHEIGKD